MCFSPLYFTSLSKGILKYKSIDTDADALSFFFLPIGIAEVKEGSWAPLAAPATSLSSSKQYAQSRSTKDLATPSLCDRRHDLPIAPLNLWKTDAGPGSAYKLLSWVWALTY